MSLLLQYGRQFCQYSWGMLETSGPWLILSFLFCGVLHAVLRPETLQRSLGNKKLSSIVKATVSGMLLPICSCGVVPLSLGLYYSGAYLGPTLAFLVATPVINPAAVILAYAMLGPQIATIYLLSGFVIPFVIGIVGNALGGPELQSPAAAGLAAAPSAPEDRPALPPLMQRIRGGIEWGFNDLAVQTCRFIVVGTAFAALLLTVVPTSFILDYLSDPRLMSLLGITLLGCVMYVCALGHIPFIAALVSAGAAPGGVEDVSLPVTSHPLMAVFRESLPDKEVLLTTLGDCNADGIEDLVVVYREDRDKNHMVAVYSDGGAFRLSAPVRAPLENCRLQWRDIDEVPPVELLVSGQKGIYIGYAVFRFVDGEWISLFGDGMDECC